MTQATTSDPTLAGVAAALAARFQAQIHTYAGDTSLILAAEQLVPLAAALRDEFNFELLAEETAVDYWPQETPRFHVVYQLRSLQHNLILGLRVPLNGSSPVIPTLEGLYPNANWFERELYDMFGIQAVGHSDLRRILMPADWQGHPLRKDYPLGYEEVQFTFNFDEIDRRKPYAKE